MTEKLPVWKVYRSHFISWRYEGCSDDIEDLDFSYEIIESLKKYGKYDAKNPAQDDFGIYDNMTLKKFAYHISLAESKGKTWKYI